MKGFCDGHINGWSSELAGPVFKGGIRDDIVVSNPETPISEYTLYHIRDPYYHLRYTPQLRDMESLGMKPTWIQVAGLGLCWSVFGSGVFWT